MADEEVVELTEEQQAEAQLEKDLNERLPPLKTVGEYTKLVLEDEGNLVFVAAMCSFCPHSKLIEKPLLELAAPKETKKNCKFYRFDVRQAPELAAHLQIVQTPTFIMTLKGDKEMKENLPASERARHVGNGFAKLSGIFRNAMIKRNEELKEWDAAKLAPPPGEGDEGEPGEAAEEQEEADD